MSLDQLLYSITLNQIFQNEFSYIPSSGEVEASASEELSVAVSGVNFASDEVPVEVSGKVINAFESGKELSFALHTNNAMHNYAVPL